MSRLNDLDNSKNGVPFPPSRLLFHDDPQLYHSYCRAAPEDLLSSVTDSSNPLVLLLAPGDPRSILYTLYRNFDPEFRGRFSGARFLVIENWSLLQAREVLMLYLCLQVPHKMESQQGRLICAAIWAIFYCHSLKPPHLEILRDSAKILSLLGASIETWRSPANPLGKMVRFKDRETLSAVARHWKRWVEPRAKGVPPVSAVGEFRAKYLSLLHMTSLGNVVQRISERCVPHLVGVSAEGGRTQVRMREEMGSCVESGSPFAEEVLELPVDPQWESTTNLTFFDEAPQTKQYNPFYGQVPYLGFFHSFLFSPSNCRDGNVARSLTDKLPVGDEWFETRPLLANSVQQLALWLSAASRAIRKFTSQGSPSVTFTFECMEPITLCLKIMQDPQQYIPSLGAPPSFDVIHTFELIDTISPPDLVLTASLLLKDRHFLIANTVDYRCITSTLDQYLGSVFGIHPQIFTVMYGIRPLGVEASFSDCTYPRYTLYNPATHNGKNMDVRTVIFQRVVSTPYKLDNIGEMGFAPRGLVSCVHATAYNFPSNRFSHMMTMESVITGILSLVQQMAESVHVNRWQFWEPFIQHVRQEVSLVPYRQQLQTAALLHGIHFHITVNERDCPICRHRPLSSFLSSFSVPIKTLGLIPHTTLGLFVSRECHEVNSLLTHMRESDIIHAVAIRQDRDELYHLDFFFPRKFADDSFNLSVVKFMERTLSGKKVQVPSILYQGPLADHMTQGSRYTFRPLPQRRRSLRTPFGTLRSNVVNCERARSVIDVSRDLAFKVDYSNLKVIYDEVTQMRLTLRCNFRQIDVHFPYPVSFPDMKIEFHCRHNTATIVAPRDQQPFYAQTPLFLVCPTNRLFMPATPQTPPTVPRHLLTLELSQAELETVKALPMRWASPVIRLKEIISDLFHFVPTTRFLNICSEGKMVGVALIHDVVIDIDTRSPAIDLSYSFLEEGKDHTLLITAWSRIMTDQLTRTFSLPPENIDFFKKMFAHFAGRTHTVYSDNNRTSLCHIKMLRRHKVEGLFTRAVIFPLYPTVDSPPGGDSHSDDDGEEEEESMRRAPTFLAGIFATGAPASGSVKRIMDQLGPQFPAKAEVEPPGGGMGERSQIMMNIGGAGDLGKLGSLMQLLRESQFSHLSADLRSTVTQPIREPEKKEMKKEMKQDMPPAGSTGALGVREGVCEGERTAGTSSGKTESGERGEGTQSGKKKKKKKTVAAENVSGEITTPSQPCVEEVEDSTAEVKQLKKKNKEVKEERGDSGASGDDVKEVKEERGDSGASGDDVKGGSRHKHRSNGKEGVRSKGRCTNCGGTSDHMKKCAGCGKPRYCSRDCQKQHWKKHKPECLSDGEKRAEPAGDKPHPPPAVEEKGCSTCGKVSEDLKRCKCLMAAYCDISCQRKNWPHHKLTCSAAPGKVSHTPSVVM